MFQVKSLPSAPLAPRAPVFPIIPTEYPVSVVLSVYVQTVLVHINSPGLPAGGDGDHVAVEGGITVPEALLVYVMVVFLIPTPGAPGSPSLPSAPFAPILPTEYESSDVLSVYFQVVFVHI